MAIAKKSPKEAVRKKIDYNRRIYVDQDQASAFQDGLCVMVAKTSNVAKSFFGAEDSTLNLGILPDGVRWMSSDRRVIIIEHEPGPTLHSSGSDGAFSYLNTPRTFFKVTLNDSGMGVTCIDVAMAFKPVQLPSDPLWVLPGGCTVTAKDIPTELTQITTDVGSYLSQLPSNFFVRTRYMWPNLNPIDEMKDITKANGYYPASFLKNYKDSDHFGDFMTWWRTQTMEQVEDWALPEVGSFSFAAWTAPSLDTAKASVVTNANTTFEFLRNLMAVTWSD